MRLTFGPPGNIIAFPIRKALRMTGRKPLGPAKIIEFALLRHRPTPLKPTPRRKAG
jgi:hypothetical protein